MKSFTRQADGSYTVSGAVNSRRVRLEIDSVRDYKPVPAIYSRTRAEALIEEAIRKGQAKANAYRLVQVEGSQLDGAARERLAALSARKAASRWREPAANGSERAKRAWETRRKKKGQ